MAFTNYTDVEIKLDGSDVFASSASANSNLSMSAVRAIGIKGAAGMIPDGPAGGDVTLDMVGGAGGYSPPTDLSDADSCMVSVGIGGDGIDVYPTSFSISMAPNEVVSASFGGQSFEALDVSGSGGSGGKAGAGGGTIFEGGHGASAGSSGAQTSAEYSFSASWDAIYFIGSMCPQFIYATDGSIECTVEGPDITSSLGMDCDNPCPDQTSVSFSIGMLCGGSAGTYSCTGYPTGGGISVSEGGVLSGTRTVVQFLA